MWFGIFLIALGILFLLKNMGIIYGNIWDWAWPILIICIGLGIIIKPKWRCESNKSAQDS